MIDAIRIGSATIAVRIRVFIYILDGVELLEQDGQEKIGYLSLMPQGSLLSLGILHIMFVTYTST